MPKLKARQFSPRQQWQLEKHGIHPLLARIYAARGITAEETDNELTDLLPPEQLLGCFDAAEILANALQDNLRILIVADYDCDGATACAVAYKALTSFGANVDYLVPNRFTLGYGLTPELVELARSKNPDLLITVDNGIADVAGVDYANSIGIKVIITDHHLAAEKLPDALAIVNPNQPNCTFPSKNLAGVGVIFYLMLALRKVLRSRGFFQEKSEPNLANLLDLVALGTVADVVKLDHNNRILVAQGLKRIRQNKMQVGIKALLQASLRSAEDLKTSDLGFAIAPRINAAGRLQDMSLGVECLITDDYSRALNIAQKLQLLNLERREIEADIQLEADQLMQTVNFLADNSSVPWGISLYDQSWHLGVVGIVAGRLKDRYHRPVFVFAQSESGELKGSGRSIPGVHLRDMLDIIHKQNENLFKRFGGHSAAAGVTIDENNFQLFQSEFNRVISDFADRQLFTPELATDGELEAGYFNLPTAKLLANNIWGQGLPAPLFENTFQVIKQQILKDKHMKFTLKNGTAKYDAILFNQIVECGEQVKIAYTLDCNLFNGVENLQLNVVHLENC